MEKTFEKTFDKALTKDNREKVYDIKSRNVVAEVFKKTDPETGKVYFDFCVKREFLVDQDKFGRGPFLQQRDCRDLIRVAVDLMEWISDQHREMRSND
jgi:hypothetical protein